MSDAIALHTASVEETRALGEAVAPLLRAGDVVSLTGELGAGKTAFVQGSARALGVETPVQSPTFVLVRDYDGRLPVHHVDVYRLERMQDVIDLGFEEMIDGDGVTFVEWGDAVETLFGDAHLRVELTIGEGDGRRIRLTATGSRWEERWKDIAAATAPWRSR